jgi:hypothetical protein
MTREESSQRIGTGTHDSGGDAIHAVTAATGVNPGIKSNSKGQSSTSGPSVVSRTAISSAPPAGEAPPQSARSGITRINHPLSGSFDVVITQSAARDDLPDVGRILTGNPVYTVYLRVGDQKEWMLEYCVPVVESRQSTPYQINIDDAAPVTPPYPISTTIPDSISSKAITAHIVFHGLLTADGNLRNLEVPQKGSTLANQILLLLGEWQFRPAMRHKKPIDVEILLVIPSRS